MLSVIRNLLRFSNNPSIENHVIYTINKDVTPLYIFEPLEGAQSEQVFYYLPKWNFYHTCRQLAKLLPDDKAVVVAHDWIELGMMSNLGLQNPVVQILHGDYHYYYELAAINSKVIDSYICISPKMFHSLKQKLTYRQNDIFYVKFPVPNITPINKLNNSLNLIYYVRDLNEHRKRFPTIIKIAEYLSETSNNYFFTIAGGGMTKDEFSRIWPTKMKDRVNYIGHRTNEEIISILPMQDIFLLPSLAEGLPVSLVEAMKAGVVPLITDWAGAVDELLSPGITGYYFEIDDSVEYANCIKKLHLNRSLLSKLSENCIKRANELFQPIANTNKIEDIYSIIPKRTLKKKPLKVYGSRLDKTWLPNGIVKSLRSIK